MSEPARPSSIDDLKALVGSELGPTEWRTVDQATIDAFADATDDHQWIHVDPERAAAGPFGSTIAHGLYSLSLTPALIEELLSFENFEHGLNYGYDKVRFINPLPVNSRIRMRAEVTSAEEKSPKTVDLATTLTIEADGMDKPILVAHSLGRVLLR